MTPAPGAQRGKDGKRRAAAVASLGLVLVAVAPVAASRAECRHHLTVFNYNPETPSGAPVVSEDWELLPPGEKCYYHWDDGATYTYNKTLPWVHSFSIPGGVG